LLEGLSGREWEQLLREAEGARLSGRIAALAFKSTPHDTRAPWLRDRLVSLEAIGAESTRALLWELNRLRRAFSDTDVPLLALKGAAYAATDLPVAVGRPSADVDILVPKDRLDQATEVLRQHGWDFLPLDPYDEQYYREWMHELPPMVHEHRAAALDVHHTILPRTGRLSPDAGRLLAMAEPSREEGVSTLCPPHMVLHACVHLFQDGEVSGALRDLVDIAGLLQHFGRDPGFWTELCDEAETLGLTRPTFYALTASARLLGTALPDEAQARIAAWAPPAPVAGMMERLLDAGLSSTDRSPVIAQWALYLRAHWLRMPPLRLAAHLLRKATRRSAK
jgi:hypothetical protein